MVESKIVRELKLGIRTNSMYEQNAVDCDATVDEMNQFYKHMADLTSHHEPVKKVSGMMPYETNKKGLNTRKKNKLVIEW